jgi:hypothetical protein
MSLTQKELNRLEEFGTFTPMIGEAMECHECPDYGTPECATCSYPKIDYVDKEDCLDDTDYDKEAADAERYCRTFLDGTLYPNPDYEDIPF